ncbi:unnamed protein product [Rotaria sp. Silwood1]|nr:unnamed protein product [Rotaria sp. Silwood1]
MLMLNLNRFVCHRWLDKKEGDGRIEFDLKPTEVIKTHIQYGITVFTGDKIDAGTDENIFIQIFDIQYEITVFTGDKVNVGSDANIFIQIFGLQNKTEEILLENKIGSFQRNSILIQRHLNQSFDERKRTFYPHIEEYWFICQQWFNNDQSNKQTIREYFPTKQNETLISFRKEVTYLIYVYTGDQIDAGTDANVFLTIYGQYEDSGSSWYLDRIEIVDCETELRYYFICEKWLSIDKDDRIISREIVAFKNKILPQLSKLKNRIYRITIINSDKFFTGINNNLYIIIYGEYNYNTDRIKLIRSKTNKNQFEIETIDIGQPKKIKIIHDHSDFSLDWLLEDVEIEIPTLGHKWIFQYDKSINNIKNDYNFEIDLYPKQISIELSRSYVRYEIKVYTSNIPDRIQLVRSKTNKDRFEKSQKNLFEIETIDIGQPKKIKISHDHSDFSLDWLLEDVEIEIPNLGHKWIFQCDKSINKRKSDYKFEIDLYPKQMSIEVSRSFYTSNIPGSGTDANVFIQIYGINKSTDKIILSNQIDRHRIFKIGSIDTFLIELDDIGDNIEKIRIGHDNQGFDPSWHLDRVEIRRLIKGEKSKTYLFKCNRWFSKSEDDQSIVRELIKDKFLNKYIIDIYTNDKLSYYKNEYIYITIYGDNYYTNEYKFELSQTYINKIETNIIHRFIIESDYLGYIYKIKIRHNYYQLLEKIQINDDKQIFTFYSQQSLSINKDDSNIEQIFYEKDYQGLIINKESFEEYIPYIIKIKTGQSYDAGTSANVFIRLIGSKGRQTSRIELKVMHRQYFQPGKIETFSLEDIDIGDVNMIEIEHNGYNIDDDWFIDDIIIEMPTKQRTFYFICNQWLSLYKGDRKTKRLFKLQDLNKESFHSLNINIVNVNITYIF